MVLCCSTHIINHKLDTLIKLQILTYFAGEEFDSLVPLVSKGSAFNCASHSSPRDILEVEVELESFLIWGVPLTGLVDTTGVDPDHGLSSRMGCTLGKSTVDEKSF